MAWTDDSAVLTKNIIRTPNAKNPVNRRLTRSARKQLDQGGEVTVAKKEEKQEEQQVATNDASGKKTIRAATFSEISVQGKIAMMLLALQFGFSPILAKYVHATSGGANNQYDPLEGLLVMEIIKAGLAFLLLLLSKGGWSGLQGAFKGWSLQQSLTSVGLSVLLFSLQDYLGDLAQRPQNKCEPTLYLIINQTKIVWAAVLLRLLVGLMRSTLQWVALILLSFASVLYTVDFDKAGSGGFESLTWSTGACFAVVVAMLSGINQTLVERTVRFANKRRDMLLFSLELCVYKVILVMFSLMMKERTHDWFEGMTGLTLSLFALNGLGGVCVAMVNAHAGGDWKGYVLIAGLILSGTWSCAVGLTHTTWNKLASVAVVSLSLYMYNTFPYKEPVSQKKTQ